MKSGKRLIARWMLLSIATKRWKILRWRIQMSRRKFVIDIFVVIPKTWRTFVATAQACVSTHMDGSRMVKHIQNAKKKRGGRKPKWTYSNTFVLSNSDTFSCIGTRQYKCVLVAAPTPHGWLPDLAVFHKHCAKTSWSWVSFLNLHVNSWCLRFSCRRVRVRVRV